MVLPEGRPSIGSERPTTPRVAVVGTAVLLLFASILVLGRLTAPPDVAAIADSTTTTEPLTAPTTTTTLDIESFTVAEIATGDRFFWVNAPPSGRFWPIDLREHNGLVYLFGSQEVGPDGVGMGANSWISGDGVQWEAVGEVIPETHTVRRVVSTEWGLIALAHTSDGAPVVWTSTDGLAFRPSNLPIGDAVSGTRFELNDAVVSNGRLLVVGIQAPDRTSEVLAALPESLVGPDTSSVRLGFDLRGDVDDGIVNIYGPLGLHAVSLEMGELDLDEDLETLLVGPDPPTRQFIWSTEDGVRWEMKEIGSSIVTELWRRPTGDLVAHGEGGRGSTILTSPDGRTWQAHGRSSRAWIFQIGAMAIWGDTMVGGGLGEDLFLTSDGLGWERLGTGEVLPDSINWRLGPAGAGEAGLVSVAQALSANSQPRFTSVLIEEGEAVLTLDLEKARLFVDHPDHERLEVLLWTRGNEGLYEIDFKDDTVTFTDPLSGEPLATVGFATLESAESSALSIAQSTERALLFTPNGEEWSVQDISNVIADTHRVDDIVVLDDRVLILTSDPLSVGASIPPLVRIVLGQIDP